MRIKDRKYQYVEVRRTSMWITPCKRSAARGKEVSPLPSELRKEFNPLRGWEMGQKHPVPRAALRLHGVIHIEHLRRSTLNSHDVLTYNS
jgi:hypothetical protein